MRGKRNKRFSMYFIIIPVLLIAGALYVHHQRANKQEPIITTAAVERGAVTASVSANGVLQPLTTVQLKSNAGGQVIKLYVDEGDDIKAGQVIARIDPTDTVMAYQQNQADLAAANSKKDQSYQQLTIQDRQNAAQLASAEQSLLSARIKLEEARRQATNQPILTKASINQAKSSLASAEASLKQTETALVPQKLTSAQSSFDQAQATFQNAESDVKRQRMLLSKGFVAKSQVDSAEEKFGVAQAQLASAKRKLDTVQSEADQDISTARARVDQSKAELATANANSVQDEIKQQEVAAAKAAVKQAEASRESAKAALLQTQLRKGDIIQAKAQVQRAEAAMKSATTQLGYTTVVAPRAGIVTKKYVEEGSIVTAGRSSFSGSGTGVGIVDIADVTRMFALVNVDETDIAKIEVGQDVDITVEAYPDELFTGKVTKIAPQAQVDQSVTTIPVTIEVDMPDKRLRPGMNVNCDFVTGRAQDVLSVPNEAIKEGDKGNTVSILVAGKQVERKVEIGLVGTDKTEIKAGLKEGEKVVTSVIDPEAMQQRAGAGMGGGMGGGGMRPGGMGGMGGMGGFGGGMRR